MIEFLSLFLADAVPDWGKLYEMVTSIPCFWPNMLQETNCGSSSLGNLHGDFKNRHPKLE